MKEMMAVMHQQINEQIASIKKQKLHKITTATKTTRRMSATVVEEEEEEEAARIGRSAMTVAACIHHGHLKRRNVFCTPKNKNKAPANGGSPKWSKKIE